MNTKGKIVAITGLIAFSALMLSNSSINAENVVNDDQLVYLCQECGSEYDVCPEVLESMIENGAIVSKDDSYVEAEMKIQGCCIKLLSYDCCIDEAIGYYIGEDYPKYDGFVENVLNRSAELEKEHGKCAY